MKINVNQKPSNGRKPFRLSFGAAEWLTITVLIIAAVYNAGMSDQRHNSHTATLGRIETAAHKANERFDKIVVDHESRIRSLERPNVKITDSGAGRPIRLLREQPSVKSNQFSDVFDVGTERFTMGSIPCGNCHSPSTREWLGTAPLGRVHDNEFPALRNQWGNNFWLPSP